MYDFGDLERHGIYRKIPYVKTNREGKKFKMDLRVDSVLDEKGTRYIYKTIDSGDELQIKIGDPDRTITDKHIYIISYKASGALTYFSDHDELYWNCSGNEWDVSISKTSCQVDLPADIDQAQINKTCYTGTSRSTQQNCEGEVSENTVTFTSSNMLQSNEGMTVVVGFPIDKVARLEPKEVVPFFKTFLGKIVAILLLILATFWYVVYPFKIIYQWYKYGRDPKGIIGEARAWFDPPKTPSGKRFMTPGEVGTLGDETVDLKDISATIVDLARRGYLRIEERKKKDFYFVDTQKRHSSENWSPEPRETGFRVKHGMTDNNTLLPFERKLLNGFFKDYDKIRLKDEELYETVEDVKKELYENVVREGLFPKNPQSIRTFYSAIGGIALGTLNLFLAAAAFIFGRNMPKKTVEGVNAFNVAKSLKNFLTSQERQLTFQADKQMFFEKLLPYAVAFGVEKIWAKRFETMNLKQPDWYQGYDSTNFNSVVLANSISSSFSSFRSAATPTSSSSGFSSGFSGGSSGGGGGGGGGGSW